METSHTVAIIPARLESTRLPRKLLRPLSGKPLLQRVYENTCRFDLFKAVYIATDSDEVIQAAKSFSAKTIKTSPAHTSGTSRLTEAYKSIPEAEIFVNIQGDEPFLKKDQIYRLISDFQKNPQIWLERIAQFPRKSGKIALKLREIALNCTFCPESWKIAEIALNCAKIVQRNFPGPLLSYVRWPRIFFKKNKK